MTAVRPPGVGTRIGTPIGTPIGTEIRIEIRIEIRTEIGIGAVRGSPFESPAPHWRFFRAG